MKRFTLFAIAIFAIISCEKIPDNRRCNCTTEVYTKSDTTKVDQYETLTKCGRNDTMPQGDRIYVIHCK